jgi:hypothetical protein
MQEGNNNTQPAAKKILQPLTKEDVNHKRHFHSSSVYPNRTNPVLSARGEYCSVQYYQKDYETLWVLKEKACKTAQCHEGLQHILD